MNPSSAPERPRRSSKRPAKSPRRRSAIQRDRPLSLRGIAPALAGALVILTARASLADHYVVPSGSMRPNVEVGDRILVDKTAYGLRAPMTRWPLVPASGPARGDVVVLDAPDGAVTLLKRVVAVPGDTVSVRGGVVDDGSGGAGATYRISLEDGGGDDFGPVRVPEGHYLVLGDNRGSSRDGRTFGLVRRDAILGKAARVVWRDGGPAWIGL